MYRTGEKSYEARLEEQQHERSAAKADDQVTAQSLASSSDNAATTTSQQAHGRAPAMVVQAGPQAPAAEQHRSQSEPPSAASSTHAPLPTLPAEVPSSQALDRGIMLPMQTGVQTDTPEDVSRVNQVDPANKPLVA